MLQPVAIPEAYKVPKMFVVASENFHATHLFKEYWKLEPLVIPQSHDNELHEIDICQPTSSQGKIRFNTFVKCREICKATRKPLYLFANPPQIVKLPLNSYKKTTLPICLRHRKKRNQFCERGVTGGKLYEGFCEVPPPPGTVVSHRGRGESSGSNLQGWNMRNFSFRLCKADSPVI